MSTAYNHKSIDGNNPVIPNGLLKRIAERMEIGHIELLELTKRRYALDNRQRELLEEIHLNKTENRSYYV
jgi:hypothetical protein